MKQYFEIVDVSARRILDSEGGEAIEVELSLDDETVGRASVPCNGNADIQVENVNTEISEALLGLNALEQTSIDAILTDIDGTCELSRLGQSAILATSLACAKAAAQSSGQSLYNYIGGINAKVLPVPVICGELPESAEDFSEAVFKEKSGHLNEADVSRIRYWEYGTLSEILDAAAFALKEGETIALACPNNYTDDSSAADISVALNADYIVMNNMNTCVLNELVRIEEELFDIAEYAGD